MLNKEECEKSLKDFTFAVLRNCNNTNFDNSSKKRVLKSRFQRQHDMLSQLIKEHFEAKAYKFEELKGGMWV